MCSSDLLPIGVRLFYVSDAWLEADGENNLTPETFYTVTEL